ncbi:ABC transporter substrate-binding protein [Saccharibacillus sp. CPCC 101409]|uniref:ABC transporter substrate-binding protein n=1 Tax=Saccharibacillus sp. CPCC 101409 TaxID=3058041 RepID=UPI002672AA4C|nr:ABC transporter substrate-binding protein [Saccharibacillus sp. CPCC 101409]MDO3413080.1 ABC transporter substrate-binding protein [Saccharibacillus sp. CPCC 101409]
MFGIQGGKQNAEQKKKSRAVYPLAALALAVATALSGCGAAAEGGTAQAAPGGAQTSAPVQGGELTYALATSPDTLDPRRSGLAVSVRVFSALYDTLLVRRQDGSLAPSLATEWEASGDGLSYTLKLRQDVKFQDGTPFNAEAVKYNFDSIIDPDTKAANALALLRPYKSSEVVDEYTIKLNLETPSQAFLGNLSQGMLSIVSEAAAKAEGEDYGKKPVGTGPFKFASWTENAEIKLTKNPDYAWGSAEAKNTGAAYLDALTFKIVPEEATRIGGVQSGQVLAAETVPPQNVVALQSDPNAQLLQTNTIGFPYTLFFNLEHKPWDELKARQAVQYAVDIDAIVKTLYLGTYERAWSSVTPGILGYDESLEGKLKPDPAKANALLDELGWTKGADGIRVKDGKKLTLHYVDGSPNREKRNDIAAMIREQLKAVGIETEVEITQDVATVVYQNWDYDLYGNSQVNSDPHGLTSFYHSTKEGDRRTLSGLSDPEVDKWLEEGAVEKDEAKRAEIYKKVQQYISDQALILPIYVFPYTVAAGKSVQGLAFDPFGYPIFNDVYLQK